MAASRRVGGRDAPPGYGISVAGASSRRMSSSGTSRFSGDAMAGRVASILFNREKPVMPAPRFRARRRAPGRWRCEAQAVLGDDDAPCRDGDRRTVTASMTASTSRRWNQLEQMQVAPAVACRGMVDGSVSSVLVARDAGACSRADEITSSRSLRGDCSRTSASLTSSRSPSAFDKMISRGAGRSCQSSAVGHQAARYGVGAEELGSVVPRGGPLRPSRAEAGPAPCRASFGD